MNTFLRPHYGHGCFADLPQVVRYFLTGAQRPDALANLPVALLRRYDAVILLLADAFGWRFYERFAERTPALQRFVQHGVVQRWTAQFPSTTAAHLTCLHTGLTPGQSGVFEWQYYEPTLDAVIEPLTFALAGDKRPGLLQQMGAQPALLYPPTTLYQQFQRLGITSYAYQLRDYAYSLYSQWILRGAQIQPFFTLPEALVNLRQQLERATAPTYFVLYFDKIDTQGHYYGPESAQMDTEIESFFFCLERALMQPLAKQQRNVLLILTADHGQVEVDPATTIYLNTDARLAGLQDYLRTDRRGRILPPGGSARDPFLYVQTERLDDAQHLLAQRLAGQAVVHKTQTLIDEGYFGPLPVSPTFLGRVGNLVILPHVGESVWWYEQGRFEQRFYGHHGGLTRAEMEIPLALFAF
jgi:hypothetical protein